MTVAASADEPNPKELKATTGNTSGISGNITINGAGGAYQTHFGPYYPGGVGIGWPGHWPPQTPVFPPQIGPIIGPGILFPPASPTVLPPKIEPVDFTGTEFFKDWMELIARFKAREELKEKEEAMKAETEVYKIADKDETEEEKRPSFTEQIIFLFTCLYEMFKPLVVWPAKATVAVAKLPVKATKLAVRTTKHVALVMMPPSLFATAVIMTITGPRWIKWCCDVGGWPYLPPGQGEWSGFYIGAVLSILATGIFLIYHVFHRIMESRWWWPTPKKD